VASHWANRISECNAVLNYILDHEPGLGGNLDGHTAEWISASASLMTYRC
jgi:hypothetical protein